MGVALVLALLAAWEYQGLVIACGWGGSRWEGMLDVGVLFLAVWVGGILPGLVLTLILLRLLVRGMSLNDHRNGFAGAGTSLLGLLWIGGAGALIGLIISIPGGREATIFLLLVVWANDISSYYVGKRIGVRRLAPSVSPGKSVEGAVGGLIASGIVGGLLSVWMNIPGIRALWMVPVAFAVGGLSQLGDLCESFVKRAAGEKDSSSLIPGHGGILDRIDGLLLAGPPFYYFLIWVTSN